MLRQFQPGEPIREEVVGCYNLENIKKSGFSGSDF